MPAPACRPAGCAEIHSHQHASQIELSADRRWCVARLRESAEHDSAVGAWRYSAPKEPKKGLEAIFRAWFLKFGQEGCSNRPCVDRTKPEYAGTLVCAVLPA